MAKKKKTSNQHKKPRKEGQHHAKKNIEKKEIRSEQSKTVSSSNSGFWANRQLQMWLVCLFGILLYANSIGNEYAVDDSIVIQRNKFTKKGMKGMAGIWGEDTFVGFFGGKRNLVSGGRYRPFTVATFALENQLFGKPVKDNMGNVVKDEDGDVIYEGNPAISHAINALLFGLLCMALYLWMLAMFDPKKKGGFMPTFIALTVALLFAAHPLHTEAVANIKGRDEIMVTLGSVLATYWTMLSIRSKKGMLYMIGAVVMFFIALFSKESAIPFLVVIPAALYFFDKEVSPTTIAVKTAPFLVAALIFWFGVRNPIIYSGGEFKEPAPELMNDPYMKLAPNSNGTQSYVDYSSSEKYGTILYTWLEYVRLMVVPHPLTNDYYPKHIRGEKDQIPTLSSPMVLISILLHIALAILAFLGLLKRQPYAFALIFYAATFSVVSNLFFPIGTNMAERFMFMPSIGFSMLCGMGLVALGKVLNKENTNAMSAKTMQIPIIVCLVVTGLYSIKTVIRNFDWYDDYTLFTKDIEVSPNSAKLNNAVSGVLQDKARTLEDKAEKQRLLEKAQGHSLKAVTMHPTYNNAWLLYGNANTMLGTISMNANDFPAALKKLDEGIKAYREVHRLRPDHNDVPINLAVVYQTKEQLLREKMNQGPQAISSLSAEATFFQKQLVDPNYKNPKQNVMMIYGNLNVLIGKSMGVQQRFQEAIEKYDAAIQVFGELRKSNPNNNQYLNYMIMGYREKATLYGQRMGQIAQAIQMLEQANQLAGGKDLETLRLLGVASGLSQNHQKAIEYFSKALELSPGNLSMLANLEIAYRQLADIAQKAGDNAKVQEYTQKANQYQSQWKAIDPNFKMGGG